MRYTGMAYDPEEWVAENQKEFGHSREIINEMLKAMRGSRVPDEWIRDAWDYNNRVVV